MKKHLLIALTLLLFLNIDSFAQEYNPCGTVIADEIAVQNDPSILVRRAKLETFTRNFIKNYNPQKERDTYIIPVVFHVCHDWGAENIPKSKIEACIAQMNKDYSATNDDIDDVIPAFQGIIGNANIEFRLAKLDPDGNCTEGITRNYTEYTYEASNYIKVVVPNWNPTKYLNIWTVHDIPGGTAAWSHFPGITPSLDGIVSEYSYVGNTGNGRHTISHETGHWLSLYHPWGATNEPNVASNCYDDDYVEDTPNTMGDPIGSCNLSQATCGSLDNVQNIMDYGGCDNMFTAGQVVRMYAALNSSVSGRNNIWTLANLIATGTNDGYTGQACAPIALFHSSKNVGCEESSLDFSDLSYNGNVTLREWLFEGGNPATSNDSAVTVTYNTPGLYDVSLTASNEFGNNTLNETNYISIQNTFAGYQLPMYESFENSEFPDNYNDDSQVWTIENDGLNTWEYTDMAAATGTGSVRIKNYLNDDGTLNSLISGNINLRNRTPKSITFNLAFAKKSSSSNGELRVYLSKNCGALWSLVYAKSGSSLVTNGGDVVGGTFIPTADEWHLETISATSIIASDHVMIKFQNKSVGGNYLYIDDVKIDYEVGVNEVNKSLNNLAIYPNPFIENSYINYSLTENKNVSITITNMVGSIIGKYSESQNAGSYSLPISSIADNIKAGIYFIEIQTGNNLITKKIIKL